MSPERLPSATDAVDTHRSITTQDFYGESTFVPPDFPRKSLDEDWNIGVVHGPSGSGKTTVLRQLFGGATGKVGTAAPDWNNTHVVSAAFKKKFGAAALERRNKLM